MLEEKEINYLNLTTAPFRSQWRPSTIQDCTHTMSVDDILEHLGLLDEVEGLHRGKLTEFLTECGYSFFEGMALLEKN